MGDVGWLVTTLVGLGCTVVTYILTRMSKTMSRIDALETMATENTRDVGNLSSMVHKNDVFNRLTKVETHMHDLDNTVKHNIPELYAKWDALVCGKRRNDG